MPLPGKLKCDNEKCGRIFAVADFRSNTPIACPRVTLTVICQRMADDHSIDKATRRKAAKLKNEWVKLEAKRKALAKLMAEMLYYARRSR